MNNNKIGKRLSRAVANQTPDVLDRILLSCEREKGANENMQAQAYETKAAEPIIFNTATTNKRKKRTFTQIAVAIAAVLALCVVPMSYNHFSVDSVIGIDVNPGIELRTNSAERVLSVTPLNEDAVIVLDGMDLKNVDLDVAVNALIGSMLKNGYVSEIKNSILITVENSNTEKGVQLQERLTDEVNSLLSAHALNAAVIGQTVSEDAHLHDLAQQHHISTGKVALIELLVSQDDRLKFEDLAKLSINEINLLITARNTSLAGVTVSGQASSGAYIGEERAKDIAFKHAGVTASAATVLRMKLDYDDGQMVYELEFDTADANYEYEIDALSGAVRSYDRDVRPQASPAPQVTPNTTSYIGDAKAKSIALTHAGLKEADVTFIKTYLERENGQPVYDVEFYSGNVEYDYEIDAISGAIREFDQDVENYAIPRPAAPVVTPSPMPKPVATADPAPNYIGEAVAKEIVLTHAGVKAADVTFIKVNLQWDDGHPVYDIEFYCGNVEYDYEIHATTGDIREHDRDIEHYNIPHNSGSSHGSNHSSSGQTTNSYISETKAKSIALAHAGLAESEVTRIRVEFDHDDGWYVYEVEFDKGRMEYSYDIDATNGNILEWDHDYDD